MSAVSGSTPKRGVKSLRDHFAALAKETAAAEAPVRGAAKRRPSARLEKERSSLVQKVRSVRISNVDNLVKQAIDFLIAQGPLLGFFSPEDVWVFPGYGAANGLKKKGFFVAIFKQENSINDWTPAELVAAQHDLKLLNLSQLLLLLRLVGASGRTTRSAQGEACNREHYNFKMTVQSIVCERFLTELYSPSRATRKCITPSRSSSIDWSNQPETMAAKAPVSKENIRWSVNDATLTDRREIGREVLLTIGLIRKLLGGANTADQTAFFRSNSATDSGGLSLVERHRGGFWWRVFLPRKENDARPRSPAHRCEPRQVLSKPKLLGKINSLAPTRESFDNYLTRARFALRPVHKDKTPPPESTPPMKSVSLIEGDRSSSKGGAWKRGISHFTIPENAKTGFELFLHFPSLRAMSQRPPGVPILAYAPQAGVTSLLSAQAGQCAAGSTSQWDILRFSPEAPDLNLATVADSLSACMVELSQVLRAWGGRTASAEAWETVSEGCEEVSTRDAEPSRSPQVSAPPSQKQVDDLTPAATSPPETRPAAASPRSMQTCDLSDASTSATRRRRVTDGCLTTPPTDKLRTRAQTCTDNRPLTRENKTISSTTRKEPVNTAPYNDQSSQDSKEKTRATPPNPHTLLTSSAARKVRYRCADLPPIVEAAAAAPPRASPQRFSLSAKKPLVGLSRYDEVCPTKKPSVSRNVNMAGEPHRRKSSAVPNAVKSPQIVTPPRSKMVPERASRSRVPSPSLFSMTDTLNKRRGLRSPQLPCNDELSSRQDERRRGSEVTLSSRSTRFLSGESFASAVSSATCPGSKASVKRATPERQTKQLMSLSGTRGIRCRPVAASENRPPLSQVAWAGECVERGSREAGMGRMDVHVSVPARK